MKSPLIFFLFPLLFTSCLVIKVYESPENTQENSKKPDFVQRQMIPSGKVIDLGNGGTQEILFYGNDNTPKHLFFSDEEHLKKGIPLDTTSIWIPSEENDKLNIRSSEGSAPLIILDGKVLNDSKVLSDYDPDGIESINVIKGDAAIKKYGDKGVNGVVEITTKKD